nr:hypothetical protein KV8917_100087 [Klebsiella variicola]
MAGARGDHPPLSARELQRRIADDWRVTSYSGLQQHGFSGGQDLLPRLDVDAAGVGEVVEEPQLTPHQFPRGAAPGTFLHSLFEELDFTQPVPDGWMAEKLQLSGFDAQWAPVLTDWLGGVLKTRLPGADIALNQLAARDKQVEMAFYLPIAQLLTAERLDALYPPVRSPLRRHATAGFPPGAWHAEGLYRSGLPPRRPLLPAGLQIQLAGGRPRGLHPAGNGAGDACPPLRSAVSVVQPGAAPLSAPPAGRL